MATTYSNTSLDTIDVDSLKSSRFLLPDKRLLPYRNAAGDVHLGLLEHSMKLIQSGTVQAPQAIVEKTSKWLKHCRRHFTESDKKPTPVTAGSGSSKSLARVPAPQQQQAPAHVLPQQQSAMAERKARLEALARRTAAERASGSLTEESMTADVAPAKRAAEPAAQVAAAADDHGGAEPRKRRKQVVDVDDDEEAIDVEDASMVAIDVDKFSSATSKKKQAKRQAEEGEEEEEEEEEAEDDDDDDSDDDEEEDEEEASQRLVRHLEKQLRPLKATLAPLLDGSDASRVLPQPRLISASLTMAPHQRIGFSWLSALHSKGHSGILADEMGLGKTCQAIALLAHLHAKGEVGPHLIVAPVSVLENWRRELERWCPRLSVLKLHGSEAERAAMLDEVKHARKGAQYHVLLCAYTLFAGESEKAKRERKVIGKACERGGGYLILDEAQQVKNADTARYRNLIRLGCPRRLLLTGTPIENSPKELLALLSFVAPKIFSGKDERTQRLFSGGDATSGTADAPTLRSLVAPFVLRRLKSHVLDSLPPKSEEVLTVPMEETQRELYTQIIDDLRQQQERVRSGKLLDPTDPEGLLAQCTGGSDGFGGGFGGGGRGFSGGGAAWTEAEWIRDSFTRLRKAAQHPLLLRGGTGLYSDEAVLRKIARTLCFEGEFTEKARDAQGPSLEAVLEEVRSSSDLRLHEYCCRYPALREYRLDLAAAVFGSGKCAALRSLLPTLQTEGHKVVIFSQWTSVLDCLELLLECMRLDYRRFDGSTGVGDRQHIIDEYNETAEIPVLLLTTRAGGLGINLTSADTVIIHDSDFNPAADRQAMDRCHRMGQLRPVRVIRLASRGTVDQRIIEISMAKHRQSSRIVGTSGEGNAASAAEGVEGEGGAGATDADGGAMAPADMLGGILREALASKPEALLVSSSAKPQQPPAARERPPAAAEACAQQGDPAATVAPPQPRGQGEASEEGVEAEAMQEDAAQAEATQAEAAALPPPAQAAAAPFEVALNAAAHAALADAETVAAAKRAEGDEDGRGAASEAAEEAARSERALMMPRLLHELHAAFGGRKEDDWSLREALDAVSAAEGHDMRAAGHKWIVKLAARHYVAIDKHTRETGVAATFSADNAPGASSTSTSSLSQRSMSADVP